MDIKEIIADIEKYCKDPLKVLDLTEQLKQALSKDKDVVMGLKKELALLMLENTSLLLEKQELSKTDTECKPEEHDFEVMQNYASQCTKCGMIIE